MLSTATSTTAAAQAAFGQAASSATAQLSSSISTSTSTASSLKAVLSNSQSSLIAQRQSSIASIGLGKETIQSIQAAIEGLAVLTSQATDQSLLEDVYFTTVSGAEDSTAFSMETTNAVSTATSVLPTQENSRAVVDASNLSTATSTLKAAAIAATSGPINSEISRSNSSAKVLVAAAATPLSFLAQSGATTDNSNW